MAGLVGSQGMLWLAPTLVALVVYGIAQGLVKQFISDVPPARYCLYFFCAKAALNFGYFAYSVVSAKSAGQLPPSPLAHDLAAFLIGTGAYVLEGVGWICYYESIVAGPISIVGTLSAAYAAPTVLFAYLLLHETLLPRQYAGVVLVILGCIGLSYAPAEAVGKEGSRRWIPLALTALAFWGLWQTVVKYTYATHGVSDAVMAIYNVAGASLTTGLYGVLFGRRARVEPGEWRRSVLPMAMMAAGDLGVIIATAMGPVSLVTPISSAYPVVTLGYAAAVLRERITPLQWCCLALVLCGMFASMG